MKYFLFLIGLFGLVGCEAPLQFGEMKVDGVTVRRGFIPVYRYPPSITVAKKPSATKPKGKSHHARATQSHASKKAVGNPSAYPFHRGAHPVPPIYPRQPYPNCPHCRKSFWEHGWDGFCWQCGKPPPLRRH